MIAPDFASFRAKRTGHVDMTGSFVAMTAGRVCPSTMGVENYMYLLNNHTAKPGIVLRYGDRQ